jgi:Fur family zinc uptake transcriptional regulator
MSIAFPPAGASGSDHDHQLCRARTLAAAERLCGEHGLRLTPQRRRVLEAVAASPAAMGAYEIIDALAADGRRLAPISVYRALDFLVGHGLIHRIDSLSAFVLCASPGASHRAQFLICRRCREIAELPSDAVDAAIGEGAAVLGFTVSSAVVEVSGLCRACSRP